MNKTKEEFEIKDGVLIKYNGYNEEVVIPNTVKKIGDFVFSNKGLTSVIIPSSVEEIGDYAFANNILTDILIPSSVKTVGKGSFSNNNLVNLVLSDSVILIEEYAFSSNALKSVRLSNNITRIKASSFINNELESVVIPSSVEVIEEYAFFNNNIKNLSISESVKKIGSQAFGDNKLENVSLPKTLLEVEPYAFYNNELESLTIYSTTLLGMHAFSSLNTLRLINNGNIIEFLTKLSNERSLDNLDNIEILGNSLTEEEIEFIRSNSNIQSKLINTPNVDLNISVLIDSVSPLINATNIFSIEEMKYLANLLLVNRNIKDAKVALEQALISILPKDTGMQKQIFEEMLNTFSEPKL